MVPRQAQVKQSFNKPKIQTQRQLKGSLLGTGIQIQIKLVSDYSKLTHMETNK